MSLSPIIVWFRRDLRLSDHQALSAAVRTGRPIIPVFIRDKIFDGLGAAPKWRFGLGVGKFQQTLEKMGTTLILKSGNALDTLRSLIAETGASTVYWSRSYDPQSIARDTKIMAALNADGIDVESHQGTLLIEPWIPKTKMGGQYKVFTPFWKSTYASFSADRCLPSIHTMKTPDTWPSSEDISAWNFSTHMNRGAEIVKNHISLGEDVALRKLNDFLSDGVAHYEARRNIPSITGTSTLSENLTYGEISPRLIYQDCMAAYEQGNTAVMGFVRQLFWREFSYHLLWHFPEMDQKCWREEWDEFGWAQDSDATQAWKKGMTGEPFVDAGMRELYTTGTMHNRLRMIVGSYLTKNLMSDWRIGLKWFEDCLIDWDPAANAMGWQWIAGCGPDAALYFRVFNPALQATRFDPKSKYCDHWLNSDTSDDAVSYFDATPRSWNLYPQISYPNAIISLADGRNRALHSYKSFKGT